MQHFSAVCFLLVLASATATPAAAQTPPDKVFEMPGVFRISLPQGWQKTKVIDDRYAVAAFSSKGLTLEVMRDLDKTPAEEYAHTITDRRLRPEADEYPGNYAPPEVLENPSVYEDAIANRFDEYTLIGGLPAQWVRYRLEYKKPPQELRATRVWTVFLLSPGEYWSLELRGDDRSWPATDSDLQRMVRSLQLLEPMQARVKAAIPPEAWKRMPSTLPEGACQFTGIASGMGMVLPCDSIVMSRWQGAADQDGLVGQEEMALSIALVLRHYVGDWSAEEFSRKQELAFADYVKTEKDDDGQKLSYHRDGKREVLVDGTPGTLILATGRAKKAHEEGVRQLLTVSKGTDHFAIWFLSSPRYRDEIDRILASARLFALQPELSAVSSPEDKKDADAKLLCEAASGIAFLASDEPIKPCPPSARELERIREDVRLLNTSAAHYLLGKALHDNGDDHAAAAEFEAAVRLNPRNAEADKEVATVYVPLGPNTLMSFASKEGRVFGSSIPAERDVLNRGIAAYERVLAYSRNANDDQYAHAELASLYALRGNTVFALFHQNRAGKDGAEVDRPQDEITTATKALKDFTEQAEAAEKTVITDPTPQNRLRRAELALKIGDFVGADLECRLAHRNAPLDIPALACLARVSEARGEHDAIVGYAQEWLALSPNSPEAYFWLARGYSWEPTDYKKAAESYEAVIRNSREAQVAPAVVQEARFWWPHCYEKAELWQEAANAYENDAGEFPADAQVLNDAGWFFATTKSALRSPRKALEYANRAIVAAPNDAYIMDTLAEAYFVNGRIDAAVAIEQKALALAPDSKDFQKQMEKFKQAKKPPQPHR